MVRFLAGEFTEARARPTAPPAKAEFDVRPSGGRSSRAQKSFLNGEKVAPYLEIWVPGGPYNFMHPGNALSLRCDSMNRRNQ